MTGNFVLDFFVGLATAGLGAAFSYGVWRLLIDEPKHPHPKR